jgi:multicomponent Na+:H+ antiporter subunit B
MAGTIFLIVRLHGLFAVVMLGGIYSLLAASMFVVLDAVDVAFTEAAVGAGISTVLMLGALALTKTEEKVPSRQVVFPLLLVVVTGAALIYGTLDMPSYGDPKAPVQLHVAPTYLADSVPKTTVPNVVTAVLASYRGYDTLGEVCVIFTAGVGVMLLLAARRRRRKAPDAGGDRA